jgi:hypothetical protein
MPDSRHEIARRQRFERATPRNPIDVEILGFHVVQTERELETHRLRQVILDPSQRVRPHEPVSRAARLARYINDI